MRMHPVAASIGVMCAGVAFGQPAGGQPAAGQPEAAPRVRFEDLPPAARLGVRTEAVRRRLAVIPTVVIVPDVGSYAAAIASWNVTPTEGAAPDAPVGIRYPVLIDDGSWRAREDIARFVRAFAPKAVVRWSAKDVAWPGKQDEMRAAVEKSAYGAWGAASLDEVKERWKALGMNPPGVVVAAPADPAWTAALALAAGHGQIFAWTLAMRDLSGTMTPDEARKLSETVCAACEASGLGWKDLGDQIDAVTLCMSTPASVKAAAGDARTQFATTDVIGRAAVVEGKEGDPSRRWAWAGQIAGNEARAAYMAMCTLFLQPERAWGFDAYENKEPFSRWDVTAAALTLEKGGIKTIVNDNGNQSLANWRNRTGGLGLPSNVDEQREPGAGIDAGFIVVNSSGQPEVFDLLPGPARAGDAPFLHVPAAVHFVHSFSAARPGDRGTIAGRFLERGAFAYVGAVHEPFLQAFMPTPLLVERMLAMGPWGASVRLDDQPPWKVAVFGDPLWTMGPKAPRTDRALPLEGATPVAEPLAAALKEKKYAEALWMLALSGRDADVAKVVRAVAKDDAAALTPEVAEAGVMSVFRSQGRENAARSGERLTLLARLCMTLEPKCADEPELRDILWHAAYPAFGQLTEDQVRALAMMVRSEQQDRDVTDLAKAAVQSLGRDRAASVLRQFDERITDPKARQAITDALRK